MPRAAERPAAFAGPERMQGAARSQWLFHWQASQRSRRRPDAQPEGPDGLLALCGVVFGVKNARSIPIAVEVMRQKDFRRTHEESPTGC
jgi:hypothetical protein